MLNRWTRWRVLLGRWRTWGLAGIPLPDHRPPTGRPRHPVDGPLGGRRRRRPGEALGALRRARRPTGLSLG
ncbi:hypothetical protein KCH_62560 [Kitasatospora cheerisanensis KCTC 2395]|uniref:Uncharacterized protein n=1 Tax=Kitasatospora cheerisanensis KCTC 2395 TaxID=1348663 RepID=A0A066YPM7_9ACTN|nr:hypothetical protein KCH_62560 [Kitasatospora cheerisanensis KCTC 2395]